jgi:hypothetical protein
VGGYGKKEDEKEVAEERRGWTWKRKTARWSRLTPGPTTLALTLKFLILSNCIGNFSSGHFFLPAPSLPSSKYLSLFFANLDLSSTRGPRSALISSLTRLMALSRMV